MPNLRIQPVFFLGFGGVGRSALRQMIVARPMHAQRLGVRLEVMGIADSKQILVNPAGLPADALQSFYNTKLSTGSLFDSTNPFSISPHHRAFQQLEGGVDALANPHPPADFELPQGTIIIDTTASEAGLPLLLRCRYNGWHAVLSNKLPLAGSFDWWNEIATPDNRWETTCGSAMPVISTLNTLLNAGDDIQRIEGSLSGTLAYLASQLEQGVAFGNAVREAKKLGYTEPDPRQDLGGRDAARKALIMARMLGYQIGMDDVAIESLYPATMEGLSVDEFMQNVDSLNEPMAKRAAELTTGGRKLRYAALVADGKCAVQLTGADPLSKLGAVNASDSIVVFTTRQFNTNPLAISGRGAGQDVTAMGVLGDVMDLAM